jgi:hypothetical protein
VTAFEDMPLREAVAKGSKIREVVETRLEKLPHITSPAHLTIEVSTLDGVDVYREVWTTEWAPIPEDA